jgi:hypothetical protein
MKNSNSMVMVGGNHWRRVNSLCTPHFKLRTSYYLPVRTTSIHRTTSKFANSYVCILPHGKLRATYVCIVHCTSPICELFGFRWVSLLVWGLQKIILSKQARSTRARSTGSGRTWDRMPASQPSISNHRNGYSGSV